MHERNRIGTPDIQINITLAPALGEIQAPYVLVREKEGMLTTLAKLLFAALTADEEEWEQAKQGASDTFLRNGWTEHWTTYDDIRLREAYSRPLRHRRLG